MCYIIHVCNFWDQGEHGLSFYSSIFQIQGFYFAWLVLVWPSRSYSTASFCNQPQFCIFFFRPSIVLSMIVAPVNSVFLHCRGTLNEKALWSLISCFLKGV